MNILYLSHLSGAAYAGPTYSVPKQIEAQSAFDQVFWYNATVSKMAEWKKYPFYHDISEYPEESIHSLPEPFNNPDLIVVELFYNMTRSRLCAELIFGKTPYIVIPRGELTKRAQARKSLKKKLANLLICNAYAKKAAAIQYLTQQEYADSGGSWNGRHMVIPNGISVPVKMKTDFCRQGIQCVFIGRIEPEQKGLDLLIEACAAARETLIAASCIIRICGPDREGRLADLKRLASQKRIETLIRFENAVYGEDKEHLLLESDVFILPSRFEGHSMALIEAMSYGLPCVVTTGSNMRAEVDASSAGWTAESTVDSLAKALTTMCACKDFTSYGQNARKLAEQYAWDTIAKESHLAFHNLVSERA